MHCVLQASDYPSTTRPCNRYPCLGTLAAWTVGDWGLCILSMTPARSCDGGAGLQTRDVVCKGPAGDLLPDDACLRVSGPPNGTKPLVSTPCALAPTCPCHSDGDCPSNHWTCNTTTHLCACAGPWAGDGCDVPLLPPSFTTSSCTDGVVDSRGQCCPSYIDVVSGLCCPEGAVADGRGRCCTTGAVDACGVCGGSGVAIDALGTCCTSALPPSGLCCVDSRQDSCGVCGGLNLCSYVRTANRHVAPFTELLVPRQQ